MLLASPIVLMVDVLPQMAAAKVYVHRVSSSCLLPLWEAHQDQQLGLTQAPCK